MKLGIRTGSSIILIVVAIAIGLVYSAVERIGLAGEAGAESREASLHTYRSAQALKSLIHGYELTINEYYSTVLEFPEYQKKATALKAAIDGELAALERLNTRPETEVAKLKASINEIDALRLELEGALSGPDKDWDLAREALYKLNLVSLQAVQSPDIIARVAEEQAVAMDAAWEGHQSQALLFLNIGLIAALLAAVLALVGAVRGGRPALPGDA
jgi:hypothetical protein